MTLPAEINADGGKSTALSQVSDHGPADDGSEMEELLARTPHADSPMPKSLGGRLLDYSAHAAMIVGLIGFAWTVSDHVVSRPTASQLEAKVVAPAASAPKRNELAELRRDNQRLSDDVRSLQASLATLRTTIGETRSSAQLDVFKAGLDDVKNGLASARSETNNALAQLSTKVETLGRNPGGGADGKLQQLADRVGRLERGSTDVTPTGSLPQGAGATRSAPTPSMAPVPEGHPKAAPEASRDGGRMAAGDASAREQGKDPNKLQVLASWVVRDVYDGVALIESRRGALEVVPGVNIPGAGTVKSIDRHGKGWTVTTTKGLLAYAALPRDDRRFGPHDGFRDDRYGAF